MRLGVFDSGLGGLTVLRRLRGLLPHADLVYFADQRHVPYGDRSDTELRALLASNVTYLSAQGVEAIVMGCNTSCAIAARYGWPVTAVPIFDLIEAAVLAVEESGGRRVGVLATTATTRSGAYGTALRARLAHAEVQEVAAPALVPLVEAGTLDGPAARVAVAAACASFGSELDTLVLACTHFPLLDATFAEILGADVVRIDPACAQATRAAAWALDRPKNGRMGGRTRFITNGPLEAFRANVLRLAAPLHEFEDVEEQQDRQPAESHPG